MWPLLLYLHGRAGRDRSLTPEKVGAADDDRQRSSVSLRGCIAADTGRYPLGRNRSWVFSSRRSKKCIGSTPVGFTLRV